MRVLFLVEAGFAYGLGHLMRCRALLLELVRRGIAADLWVRGEPSALDGLAWPDGVTVRVFGDDVLRDALESEIASHLGRKSYEWVAVDGYGFSGKLLYDRLTAYGSRVFMLDDFADRTLKTDVLLNQNTERRDLYQVDRVEAGQFLLGPRYALIASDYQKVHWETEEHRDLKRVLISFGGVDRLGRTQRVLTHLGRYEMPLELDVVVGPYYPFGKELIAYRGPHQLTVHRGLTSLAALMHEADLMISAASSTVWQACCVGVPVIAIQTQDNQRELYRTLREGGIALCAEASTSVDLPESDEKGHPFIALFRSAADPTVRYERSLKARQTVDGLGISRVADVLMRAGVTQEMRA